MGDMGDFWNDVKEAGREAKQRRQNNAGGAVQRLQESGLEFTQFSEEHFRVYTRKGDKYFDYWPSTGRWRSQDMKKTGFNIAPLLKACQ